MTENSIYSRKCAKIAKEFKTLQAQISSPIR